MSGQFETHVHAYIVGPKVGRDGELTHSHDDGSTYHRHPDTGPACFVIDKDDWAAMTGLKGGGRKTYAKAPEGVQLERISPEPDEDTFAVVVHHTARGTAGGSTAVTRMALGFDMEPTFPESVS